MNSFSVLMAVYKNDDPAYFRIAVESISIHQTRKPDEIIIVVDGPIPDSLDNELKHLSNEIPIIKVVYLKVNKGLGNALRIGTQYSSNEIIARMDSDDIAFPDRFKKQISFLEDNNNISIVGGQISEFIDIEVDIVGNRIVPCEDEEIKSMMKKRCPFNHMTVAFRRSKVLDAGNYKDWHYNEDYYLWIRMMEHSMRFANLPDTLVNVRVGKNMYARRGGWKYFKSEKGLQDYMLQKKMITLPRYIFNVAVRFGVQMAMPNSIRGFVFQKLFRK